ncbi:hypothetical protein [Microbulbifer spongiae]|uniref:Uncharacterized protein n=1 Tax=Microbulbifer spongiae TaxID=2944933 RepID=A0ABY9ED50_9GAMM|nr:hypothetical protein [Microbulbifer sp. MI-G]WKD50577.1 hypothetical protein M8T91_03890 [Microbulbifer sp. MI-G]
MSTEIDITGRIAGKLTVPRKNHSHMAINGVAHSLHYDANGTIEPEDAVTGDDKWIRLNARQLPKEIVLGSSQNDSTPTARGRFRYGPDGQRFYRESHWSEGGQRKTGRAYIVGYFGVVWPEHDASFWRVQRITRGSSVQHLALTDPAAISDPAGTSAEYRYLHRDHLGSVEKIADADGLEILSTAPWCALDG